MDWSVKKAAPVRTYRGISRVCMPQTHIYFLSEKAESESVAWAECKRARSLSDQPTVPSDISVTPQRIMTVVAAVPCVVLKRFISSCALSSASAQVLNNAFLFYFFFLPESQKRLAGSRHTSATREPQSRLALCFSWCKRTFALTRCTGCLLYTLLCQDIGLHRVSLQQPTDSGRKPVKKLPVLECWVFFSDFYLLLLHWFRITIPSTKMSIIMDMIDFSLRMLPHIL